MSPDKAFIGSYACAGGFGGFPEECSFSVWQAQ
jgi:hypothetical protein